MENELKNGQRFLGIDKQTTPNTKHQTLKQSTKHNQSPPLGD